MKTYNKHWASIVELMDDDIREQVHADLAPCTNEEFLARYLDQDPEFEVVLDQFEADED